jgi:thioredoxin-related protein
MSTRTVGIVIVVALVVVGLIVLLTSSGDTTAESPAVAEVKWHSFDEGVALARQENKKILVDVYTDWCVWCKKMDKEVYTNGAVGQTMTSNFIAVKLNAESQKGVTFDGRPMNEASLAGTMGVTGYPTVLFLDPAAKPITKISGYMEPKEFTSVLRFIGEDHYKTKSFQDYKNSIKN